MLLSVKFRELRNYRFTTFSTQNLKKEASRENAQLFLIQQQWLIYVLSKGMQTNSRELQRLILWRNDECLTCLNMVIISLENPLTFIASFFGISHEILGFFLVYINSVILNWVHEIWYLKTWNTKLHDIFVPKIN